MPVWQQRLVGSTGVRAGGGGRAGRGQGEGVSPREPGGTGEAGERGQKCRGAKVALR